MPTWPEDYAYTKSLGREGWAWEFVRRNPEYRKDWEEALDRFQQADDNENRVQLWYLSYQYGQRGAGDKTLYNPDDRWFGLIFIDCMEKWGFYPLRNPDLSDVWLLFFGINKRPFSAGSLHLFHDLFPTLRDAPHLKDDTSMMLGAIDLTQEVAPQVKKLKAAALRAQKHFQEQGRFRVNRPKRQVKKWPFYLYLLDASDERATLTQIADLFEADPLNPDETMDEKQVSDRLIAARKLTEPEGYLSFLGLD